jgi:hypothetical protein
MAKTPANQGKHWTPTEIKQLKVEARHDTPTRLIALHLKRSEDAVRAKASEIDLSLKPVNQSPYGWSNGKKPK